MKIVNMPLLLLIFFVTACSENRTEVFLLADLSYVEEMERHSKEKYKIKNEFFVISNIPNDKQGIQKIIKKYNSDTMSSNELKKYYGWIRMFYRESPYTPRDYKEENRGYFEHDRIEFHNEDLVLIVKWTGYGENIEYLFQDN